MTSTHDRGPRYDGLADWYDEVNAAWAEGNRAPLLDLLGPATGL